MLEVALFTALAAAAASLGALPLKLEEPPPRAWLGWANAVASGLMLGAGYVLSEQGLAWPPLGLAAGSVVGIAIALWGHSLVGSGELDLNVLDAGDYDYRRRVFWTTLLHGTLEGIAFGVAMRLDFRLGVLVALALAVHNVAEGATLCAVLGRPAGRSALRAVAANVPAVPMAMVAYVLTSEVPATTPWMLGIAVGTLIYLVMVDLLPEAYREAGHTSIALLVSVTLGAIVLLEAGLP